MDKNEYNLRLEEINKYVDQENYDEAANLADTIEWKRVRNVRTLIMISEVYEAVGRMEDSKELLLKVYRRSPVGKTVLYRLVEVTIGLKQFDEAIEYYSEYIQAAPHDSSRYILKYKIYKGRGSSVDEQIEILREYLDQEYNEKYAYELAKLYQQADRIQECLAACDDLVLWFQSGHYVLKALELKKRYAALTPKQQDIYDRELTREESGDAEEEIGQEKQMVDMEDTTPADYILEDATKAIAESVKDTMESDEEAEVTEAPADPEAAPTVVIDTEAIRAARREAMQQQEALNAAQEQAEEEKAAAAPAQEDASAKAADTADTAEEWETETDEDDNSPEETAEEAGEQEPAAPAVNYDPERLQSDVAQSMREITSGVGRRDEVDPDEEIVDRVIEESKKQQEQAMASREDGGLRFRMSNMLKMPGRQSKAAAGKLSIDDVLLSMGEKGTAVRQAVAKAGTPSKSQPAGVLSAVDEALLNMGVTPEHLAPESETEMKKRQLASDDMEELSFLQRSPAEKPFSDTREMPTAEQLAEAMTKTQVLPTQEELAEAAAKAETPAADEAAGFDAEAAEETAEAAEEPVNEAEELANEASEPAEEIFAAEAEDDEAEEESAAEAEDDEAEEAPAVEAENDEAEEAPAVEAEDDEAEDASAAEAFADAEEAFDEEPEAMTADVEEDIDEMEFETEAAADEAEDGDAESAEYEETADDAETAEDETSEEAGDVDEMSMDDIINARTRRIPREQIEEHLQQENAEGQDKKAAKGATDAVKTRRPRRMLPVAVRSYFDGFVQVQDLEMQISLAISGALAKGQDRTSRTGNVLIFGGHGSGKTTLATALAKSIAQMQGKEFVKMARIYATDLNRKDIAATIAKIAGGILIVEEAGDLEDAIADQLTTAMEFRTDGLVIIMEDEEKYLREVLMRHPRLTMKFTSQIYLPNYTVDELVGFAQTIAGEHECILSEDAADVLAADLEDRRQKGTGVSLIELREIVEKAVRRADKFTRRVFGGRKRYDEYGRILLQAKDIR